jgi:hypothetical protein
MERRGSGGNRTRARPVSLGLFTLAVVGAVAGVYMFWFHLTTDPLADVQAYYGAAARLNAGLPLYPAGADTNVAEFYRYPPLLAILFRPLALLPFEAAAAIWEVLVIASLVATVWWIGLRRRETWLALGLLAFPIAWCVTIGQAQVPLTLLTAIGAPWSIALAAHIKLFPALVALWWIGRRDWRRLGVFAAWTAGLGLVQLVLAPQATLDFLASLTLEQVGAVRNISPYAVSPRGRPRRRGRRPPAGADSVGLGRRGDPERGCDPPAPHLHVHDVPGDPQGTRRWAPPVALARTRGPGSPARRALVVTGKGASS